jgi:hypothetical protein
LLSGKYVPCAVFSTDRVSDLGGLLPGRHQKLARVDRTLVFVDRELRPSELLSEIGIVNDSVLQLIAGGELERNYSNWIIVVTPTTRVRYGIKPSETVEELLDRFSAEEPYYPSTLFFGGQPLRQARPFGDCGISNGSVLTGAGTMSFDIQIKDLTGKRWTIPVTLDTTIERVKEKLAEVSNYNVALELLIFGGRQLDPERPISDYGITRNSLLHCVLNLRGYTFSPSAFSSNPPACHRILSAVTRRS